MGSEQSVPKAEVATTEAPPEEAEKSEGGASPSALVICGPSGVGKGTLIQILLEESNKFGFSVSHTTRSPRTGEKNGVHYHFVDKANFEKGIECNSFLEYAKVHEHYYGTSRAAVESVLETGVCCILDIDVQGARQVRRSGLKAVFVFIAPPSDEELERRLRERKSDSEEQINIRLKQASIEMDSMSEPGLFDFCVVNDDLSQTYAELKDIAIKAKDGILPEMVENGETKSVEKSEKWTGSSLEAWKGKVAFITDACSATGSEICREVSRSGMKIIAVGKNKEYLEKLQQSIIGSGIEAQNLLPIACDTSKEGEVATLKTIVQKRWPQTSSVDVLINITNAYKENASLLEGTTTSWVGTLSSNVLACCLCSREVIKSMKLDDEHRGYVINIATIDEDTPKSAMAMLKATNAAIKSLSEDLEVELKEIQSNARVVCISNGDERGVSVKEVVKAVQWVLSAPPGLSPQHILLKNGK